jgi:hypothetical protein
VNKTTLVGRQDWYKNQIKSNRGEVSSRARKRLAEPREMSMGAPISLPSYAMSHASIRVVRKVFVLAFAHTPKSLSRCRYRRVTVSFMSCANGARDWVVGEGASMPPGPPRLHNDASSNKFGAGPCGIRPTFLLVGATGGCLR